MPETIELIETLYGPPTQVLSSCLRAFIAASPGHTLVAADFSSIEARGLAWLADQRDDLAIFESGEDIYLKAASDIYGRRITKDDKDERQIGKVATLALGYQGGVGAFQTMAKAYGVKVSDSEADTIKVAWRDGHKKVVQYWYDLESAAMRAVNNPGASTPVGPAGRQSIFMKPPKGNFLLCKLPSKRMLYYPYPSIIDKTMPWGAVKPALQYKGVDSVTRQWKSLDTYGGKLCENITQAICRDLLAGAVIRLEREEFPVVMHVHDEVVCEVPEFLADDRTVGDVERIMSQLPAWAEGFPVEAVGWMGKRYRK